MNIKFENTKTDYLEFYKSFYLSQFHNREFGLMICSLAIGLVVGCIAKQPFSWVAFGLATVLSFFMILIYGYLYPYFKAIRRVKKMPDKKVLGEITEEGFTFERETGQETWLWESIRSAHINDKFIWLFLFEEKFILIPRETFTSDSERANIFGIIQQKIPQNINVEKAKALSSKPNYKLGFLCLIPLFGAIFGFVLLMQSIFKYKDRKLALIGIGGILFTVLVYGILFFGLFGFRGSMFKEHAQSNLNELVEKIEFYKIQHGQYPDSLQQLLENDQFSPIYDPIQTKPTIFNYRKMDNYYRLYSSGVDGEPDTHDDLCPQVNIDARKIGLINFQE